MSKICAQKAAILNLAAILDFGTEEEMVPNLDVFRIQKPSSVPILTTFSQFEQLLSIVSPICSTNMVFVPLDNIIIMHCYHYIWTLMNEYQVIKHYRRVLLALSRGMK